MSVLQAALDLASRGVPVFPCLDTKAPACPGGFKAASTDQNTVRRLFASGAPLIGVPTGEASGLDVLDTDPRNGCGAWLAAHEHLIPLSRVHDTRSGGMHVLLRHKPGLGCSNGGKVGPRAGVDVKADGGYIIWWPAAGCQVVMDEDPAPWPAALLDALNVREPAAAPSEPADRRRIPPRSEQDVVAVFDALPNPPHTTRDQWNAAGLAAVGCIHDTDGDMHGPIAEAFIGWAERGDDTKEPTREKWESDWSRRPAHSVHAGYDTLRRVARELDPAFVDPAAGAEFEALPPLPVPAPAPRRKGFVSRDFQINPHDPYVIKHLVAPGNVCVLLGQPGAGKSTLAPHLAYAVAQGRRVFGMRTTPGRALYIAAEDLRGVEKRVGTLGMRHGHTDDCLVVGCGNLRDPGECAAVFATVAEFKPALIVVDTVAAAFAGMDENTSQDMGQVVQFARRLASTGAAVILVHHPAKSGDGSPRGHGSLNGTLDMTLTLAPDDVHDPDTVVRGQTPKNRNGTTARDFAFRKEVIRLGVDDEGDPITTTLPVELDTADSVPAKPAKLSRAEAAAMGALHALLNRTGADRVAEGEWLEACAALSTAEKPRDRLRSARNIRAGLVEKGAVCVANGLVVPVVADPGTASAGITLGSTQSVEFVDGIEWDQTGINMGSKPGNVGWMGSTPKGDPIPSHAILTEFERIDQ